MRKSSAFIAAMLIVLILAASCSPSTPAVRDITDNEYAMLGIAMMPIVTAFIPGTDPPFVTMTNPDSHTAIIEFDYDKIEGEGFKDGSGALMTLVFEEDITGLDYRLLPDSGYGSLDFDVTVITTNGLEYRFEVIEEGPFSPETNTFDYSEVRINGELVNVPQSTLTSI